MSKKNEKIDPKALAKELLNDRTHGAAKAGAEELQKADAFAEGYKAFMNAAKTERETVTWAVQAAEAAGFEPLRPMKMYQPGDKVYYNNRGKALCLAVIGKKGVKRGVRIAAAHIDSPRIDLKPIPLYESSEMALLKTHYYGGIKKYQWTARSSARTAPRSPSTWARKRAIPSSPSPTSCPTWARTRWARPWGKPSTART